MPLKAPVKGGSDFEPLPAGTHPAVCYGVVDLGTLDGGQFGPSHKIMILWEIPGERITLERDGKDVDLPRAISSRYTLSLHKKANLRAVLEGWRAKPFTDDEAADFDIATVVGANCLLSVVHTLGTGKNAGRTFANVRGVSSLPKGMPKQKAENPPLVFILPNDGEIVFPENMPEWIKEVIQTSEEFRGTGRFRPGQVSPPPLARSAREDDGESFENAEPVRRSNRPAPTDDGSAFGSKDGGDEEVPF